MYDDPDAQTRLASLAAQRFRESPEARDRWLQANQIIEFRHCMAELGEMEEMPEVAGFDPDNLPSRQSMLDLLNQRLRDDEGAGLLDELDKAGIAK